MSEEWDTKDGRRRVRRDPPTIDDAVLAAQGMAEDDIDAQVEIVMSLMAVSAEEARGAVLKNGQRKDREAARFTIAGTSGAPRTVVVERRTSRRPMATRPTTTSASLRSRILARRRRQRKAISGRRKIAAARGSDPRARFFAPLRRTCGSDTVPDKQDDHGADRGGDQARALVRPVMADRLTDEGREESADDAEHRGQMKPEGLFGPGCRSFAMMPAMKPMMTTQSMPMTKPSVTTLQ